MEVTVAVPASCGELVQGYWRGEPFLVTLPINRYAVATVRDDGRGERPTGWKSREALRRVLDYFGVTAFPYSLTVSSAIPRGKGMASSSADIGAVLYAAATALGKTVTAQEAAYLAASIEPTDGVFCPDSCCLNYETGQIHHVYTNMLPLTIVMIDTGGIVDTLQFHERCQGQRSREIDASIVTALQEPWTYDAIGQAATASALANQAILPKPHIAKLYDKMKQLGAIGLNVAHSGTMIGVLFRPTTDENDITRRVQQALQDIHYEGTYYDTVQAVRGGYTVTYR